MYPIIITLDYRLIVIENNIAFKIDDIPTTSIPNSMIIY